MSSLVFTNGIFTVYQEMLSLEMHVFVNDEYRIPVESLRSLTQFLYQQGFPVSGVDEETSSRLTPPRST